VSPTRSLRSLAVTLALVLAALSGCATAGLTPAPATQPVARQALFPEYRVFYDALIDYGDWVLIEPYGFVFRPRVAWNQWQPFEDGFWAATDTYGWVWISAEPFGWATYHYGQWLFDRFQGWVWIPGLEWMPGSVSWYTAGDYVGWAPLASRSAANDPNATMPDDATHFTRLASLGSTDLRTQLVSRAQMGAAAGAVQRIRNVTRVEGATIDRGPAIEMVEQARGPILRTRIEDLVPLDLARRIAGPPTRAALPGRVTAGTDADARAERDAIDATQRAAERAASEGRRLVGMRGSAPPSVVLVRPILSRHDESPLPARRPPRPAAADSTR